MKEKRDDKSVLQEMFPSIWDCTMISWLKIEKLAVKESYWQERKKTAEKGLETGQGILCMQPTLRMNNRDYNNIAEGSNKSKYEIKDKLSLNIVFWFMKFLNHIGDKKTWSKAFSLYPCCGQGVLYMEATQAHFDKIIEKVSAPWHP